MKQINKPFRFQHVAGVFMPRFAVVIFLAVLLGACASGPEPTDQLHSVVASDGIPGDNTVPVESQRVSNDSEKICRRIRDTGSNIPRKVCRTRAEIERERAAHADALTRTKLRPISTPGEGGG
jgi:hypothetical protein